MTDTANTAAASGAAAIQRFNNRAGLMNPEGNGLYVRYEDHVAALAAPAQAVLPNPYANMGSMEEAWRKGYEGGRAIAAPGSEYMRVFKAGEAARAAVQAVPAPGVPSDATIAVHEACGKIIKTLAAIVNSPQSDDQFDREVLQRDPVMAKVMEVKSQVDAIYKAVPLPIHPYMQRQKAAAGAPAAPAQAGEYPELPECPIERRADSPNPAKRMHYIAGWHDCASLFHAYADATCAARGAAQAAPVDAAVQEDADMFWDANDPERPELSLHNLIVEAVSNSDIDVGGVVEVMLAKRLPHIKVQITALPDDAGGGDIEWEVLDAARAAQKGTND